MDLTIIHSSILSPLSPFNISLSLCMRAQLPKHHDFDILPHIGRMHLPRDFWEGIQEECNSLEIFHFENVFILCLYLIDGLVGNNSILEIIILSNMELLLCSESWNHLDFWSCLWHCFYLSASLSLSVVFFPTFHNCLMMCCGVNLFSAFILGIWCTLSSWKLILLYPGMSSWII